jgi:beta-phosphoglucomutase
MKAAAVIFDFDGVLANTEQVHLRAIQDALAVHGRTLDRGLYFERYLGFGDRDLFFELARDLSWPVDGLAIDDMMSMKADRFRHHLAAGDALFPAAAACVERLGARFPLAIASGSLHGEIEHILATARLHDAFRAIVGADDVEAGKPAPDPYLRAAALLGVDPREAVAIEDSRWGLDSARAAGLRTIAVTTSYPPSELDVADHIVGSLDDISLALIDRL